MKLVLAEKPSVAMSPTQKCSVQPAVEDGYLEGNGYLVSWCVGHLVELAPARMSTMPSTSSGAYADLPILPQKWQYLVSASPPKSSLASCKKLMHRSDVESIVNSCNDAG